MVLIFWLSVFIHDNYYLNCCSNTNRRSVKLSCYQKIWSEQFSSLGIQEPLEINEHKKKVQNNPITELFYSCNRNTAEPLS